ncbi:MAG TPA: ATPase/DNA packaging protein [Aquella sp.]|nr:ATPase/DNA packaging protein [Aquella sp.]
MNVIDFSKRYTSNKKSLHSQFFPANIMAIVAGRTGSGKTNLIIHLLTQPGLLYYSFVHVYSATLYQEAYVYLRQYYEKISQYVKSTTGKSETIANFYSSDDEILDPSQLDKNYHHIMIFDDVMLKEQSVIKEYFCRGRHNNVNVFYLVQSLHKISKHCIRENANIFILFHQDDKTLRYFHETHISGDMPWDEFKRFCGNAWNRKHGFVVINLFEDPYCGRYLDNYKSLYIPLHYEK